MLPWIRAYRAHVARVGAGSAEQVHFAPHVRGAVDAPPAHVTSDVSHGRGEVRRAWAVDVAACPRVAALLPTARSGLCLVRQRTTADGTSCDAHYYISSRAPDAARLAAILRSHWSIENNLHRTLDVALHEAETLIRKGPGAENLALVRRLAETVLRRDTVSTRSMPKKMQRAALDDDYRAHLITLDLS